MAVKSILYTCEKAGISREGIPAKNLLQTLYINEIYEPIIDETIKEIYERERAERRKNEPALLAELYKLRVFDWGGIHQNDINKYLVNNYIKKITNYDELIEKIENEILHSLKEFVLCSWYNNWTYIIIEDIFKDHTRVLPTVGKIKQVDFFIDGIPFDLKMTYFPGGFMKKQRQERGLVSEELSELKKAAKDFKIPFDSKRSQNDLILDLIAAFSESSDEKVKSFYRKFISTRREVINQTIQAPRELLRWLYEQQGNQRFDASNRIFLIVINQNAMEESWKIKRDYQLLKREIDSYLDSHSFNLNEIWLEWSYAGRNYQSYTDVLFVVK